MNIGGSKAEIAQDAASCLPDILLRNLLCRKALGGAIVQQETICKTEGKLSIVSKLAFTQIETPCIAQPYISPGVVLDVRLANS